jgi:hypothetical protein
VDCAAPRRFRPVGADDGSLPMTMLLILVTVSLSTLLVPMGVAQVVATRTTSDRTRALHAAQTGLDVLVGRIRAAVDSSGNGVATSLPTAAITGSTAPDGTERYRASVTYYASDGGAFTVAGATTAPSRAVLVSTGIDAASVDPQYGVPGSRTIRATYEFRTSNENTPGGKIPVNASSTALGALCVAAASAKPSVGSPVSVRLCTGDANALRFVYTTALTLRLYGSETVTARGLCLQGAGDPTLGTYAHTVNQQIVLAACAAITAAPHSKTLIAQQWSLQSYGVFWGTTDGIALDSYCLTVAGSALTLSTKAAGSCASSAGYDNKWTLLPEPEVGAGYAGASQNWLGSGNPATARQMVSVGHEQFGRCVDIAGTDKMADFKYLIAWPCKQSPDPAKTPWGQMWILPAIDPTTKTGTGLIKSYDFDPASTFYGHTFCLKSNGLADPWVTDCSAIGVPTADLLWTLTTDTSVYSTSFVIRDNVSPGNHLCLTPAGPNPLPSELYTKAGYTGPPISRVVLRTCDGTQWQKWNAPANLTQPSPVTDFTER